MWKKNRLRSEEDGSLTAGKTPGSSRRGRRLVWRGRQFFRSRSGNAAVEFGIVSMPFFALLYAIFETSLVFLAGQSLETGVSTAGRLIRTGQLQAAGLSEQQFRTLICANQAAMLDCDGRLRVDVRNFANFGNVVLPPALDGNGDLQNNFVYQPGVASDVVVVRAFYDWDLLIPDAITGLSNMNGSKRLVTATAAFRNEPF